MARRTYDVVRLLAREWTVRERGFTRPDRRAMGAGRPRRDPNSRRAAGRLGGRCEHGADVAARIQILRAAPGSGIWIDRDPDGNRDPCGLEVQAVGLDLVDQGRARNPQLERGPRTVPAVMPQRALDVVPLHLRQRLRQVTPVGRGALP